MPRLQSKDVKPIDIYGQSDVDNTITFRERLMTRFKAYDHVQVMNIDDEPIEWQYLPDHAETSTLTDEGIKITYRDDPELWKIDGGELDILPGACAFIMIENLYKKMIIKKVGIVEKPTSEKQVRNFNFKDPIQAEKYIDLIFQGKVNPSFNQSQPNQVVPKKPNVKTDTDKSKV